jgi:hypothetical protein
LVRTPLRRKPEMPWGYSDEEWETAKLQAKETLREHARRRETTTYSGLCDDIAVARFRHYSWSLMALLGQICAEEDSERGIMLASLVCKKGGDGLPGEGYFAWAAKLGRDVSDREVFWEDEVERIFASYRERP